jgi:ribosomal protein S18 acetylase RimI-like enzyme
MVIIIFSNKVKSTTLRAINLKTFYAKMETDTFNYTLNDLQETSLEIIADTFTRAFENYFIPLTISPAQLADKIKAENINLGLSIGCFDEDKLIGFILVGLDMKDGHRYAYNAGTGVLHNYRGQKMAANMYRQLIIKFHGLNIHHHVLEVIKENTVAVKLYQQCGFQIRHTYYCYQGKFKNDGSVHQYAMTEIDFKDIAALADQLDFKPTWQNSLSTIERAGFYSVIGCFVNQQLAGYIVYDKSSGKVRQFAVKRDYRKMGIGSALFHHVQKVIGDKKIVITYIEINDQATNAFLHNGGLEIFLNAHEMEAVL